MSEQAKKASADFWNEFQEMINATPMEPFARYEITRAVIYYGSCKYREGLGVDPDPHLQKLLDERAAASNIKDIIEKWPGDETDEEIAQATKD